MTHTENMKNEKVVIRIRNRAIRYLCVCIICFDSTEILKKWLRPPNRHCFNPYIAINDVVISRLNGYNNYLVMARRIAMNIRVPDTVLVLSKLKK